MTRQPLPALLAALFLASACVTASPATTLSPGTDWVANSPGWAEEAQAVYDEATAYVETIAASRPGRGGQGRSFLWW